MTPNNNLSVLPWYTDINLQNHRKNYAYGSIYPLYTPARTLLPFQIIRNTRENAITGAWLYDKNGNKLANITTQMNETGLQIVRFSSYGYDVIMYPGLLRMAIDMPDGIYYVQLTDGVQIWYSDMFTAINGSMDGYLKIEWYDADDMVFDDGRIVYVNPNFKNFVYLRTEVGKPDYEFEEEGEDKDGYFFPEKQISEKTYRFIFLAPEYLCDALRIVRMSDYVTIYYNGQTYDCDTFLITPKWQTQGDLASIEAEFQCATVIKKIGRGYIQHIKGDYNKDFNIDFNNND